MTDTTTATPAPAKSKTAITPRPFLKWVGGKGQLLPELRKHVPSNFGNYFEPFLGGGAMFFDLARAGRFTDTGRQAWLSDANNLLVRTYLGVKHHLDVGILGMPGTASLPSVVARLELLQRDGNSPAVFDYMKAQQVEDPTFEGKDLAFVAAWMIYINKTCFNGLYRVNSKGCFNVGFGDYKNPKILDEENLNACCVALGAARIDTMSWETALWSDRHGPGDLVYVDPPYMPAKAGGFVSYGAQRFGMDDHANLARRLAELKQAGVSIIVSQSDDPRVRELYPETIFNVHRVEARRNVNSKGSERGPVGELIIT